MPDIAEDKWKDKLTPEQYHILREKGTEAPFSGKLLHQKGTGDFVCAACGNIVFKSDTKFDSGTGWPSFYDMADEHAVTLTEDKSLGMTRTEVTCSNCGSHLGHLFHDVPEQPTGMRFCINSAALDFKEKK
ncbi:MAG TPA: peptide-methionine (R)-S-oxide reductase MsrB [Verrucomicrobiae bacterium]|jgi:peptide-methionine (R)-S-oxide reductase|nr:peptide-methionine (R)-S-oxide reductase MsrB [Verrucomicrobiae bacterium]